LSVQEQLYDKVSDEFDKFLEELKGLPPAIVMEKAYEKVIKEDLVNGLCENDLPDSRAQVLLELDYPLQSLYSEWLETDASHMDILREHIDRTADFMLEQKVFESLEHTGSEEMETETTPGAISGGGENEMESSEAINGVVQPGDWVIGAAGDEYAYLIGVVTSIEKPGTPEHGTENETDDIHVDFTAFDYPPERIAEIEGHFSELYGYAKPYDELPLDDVIMAPEMLISISHLTHEEIEQMGNSLHDCEAFCECFTDSEESYDNKHTELMGRLDMNLAAYHDSLMGLGKRELIDMAAKINSMAVAHGYMNGYGFDDDELDFYLKFQNPLQIVADAFSVSFVNVDDDLSSIMYDIYDKQDALVEYPLMREAEAHKPPEQEKPEKGKSAFERGLGRGKEKAEAYKAQKAQTPAKDKTKRDERG
jgi:hypothetical protein